MKKLYQLLALMLILTLNACTGGNVSADGIPTWTDYIPFVSMSLGTGVALIGGYLAIKGHLQFLKDKSKEAQTLRLKGFYVIGIGAIPFIFGLATYL